MTLFELFADDIVEMLRSDAIDFLTPLAAKGIPFVTLQAIADKLSSRDVGVEVDRTLLMKVLDPNAVPLITKIEGDKIYFEVPSMVTRAVDDGDKQREKDRLKAKARKLAKKAMREK